MRPEDSFIPIYYRLEKYLRGQILSGALRPGDLVAPESQLAQQFGDKTVTIPSVRRDGVHPADYRRLADLTR